MWRYIELRTSSACFIACSGEFQLDDSRINNRLPIAKEGFPFIGISCGLTLILLFLGYSVFFVLGLLITFFIVYFFRDPERERPNIPNAVLTPADGRILEVKQIDHSSNPLGEPGLKISIFMSVFNVHVNRIPVGGTIEKIDYHAGKFFSANLDKASEQNENNRVTLRTPASQKIVIIQIAGLIARRIVCWVAAGDRVDRGQRFGLIRFGSRLELFLPEHTKITVEKGQKVIAGETIIGYLQ